MAWKKGLKRAGYIKKDGKPALKRGDRIKMVTPPVTTYQQVVTPEPGRVEKPALHGMGSRPVIEPCPKCNFAYADGGYCESCGWTLWKGRGN